MLAQYDHSVEEEIVHENKIKIEPNHADSSVGGFLPSSHHNLQREEKASSVETSRKKINIKMQSVHELHV